MIATLAATSSVASSCAIVGCGKHDASPESTKTKRPPFGFASDITPLAGKDAGADAEPRPDPCPGCGMG